MCAARRACETTVRSRSAGHESAGEEYVRRQDAYRITVLVGYEAETASAFWESAGSRQDRQIGRGCATCSGAALPSPLRQATSDRQEAVPNGSR
jgi:hypothetical protein